MNVDYDLIIVGGAVSGGVMAALLGQSDLKIGIVESRVHNPENLTHASLRSHAPPNKSLDQPGSGMI